MPHLYFEPEALAALEHFRVHDSVRAEAHERALDTIRDGAGRRRAIWVASKGVYLTGVAIAGRDDEDVIVWLLLDDPAEAAILHIGRSKL